MDLRGYKVPADIGKLLGTLSDKGPVWYQPFIFTDKVITGTGALWSGGIRDGALYCTESDPEERRQVFLKQAIILGDFYHRLVDLIQGVSGDAFASQSYLDVGCNVGHFCFDLVKRGALNVTGIDTMPSSYKVVSDITGLRFNYVTQMYSEVEHRVTGVGTADVSLAIAVSTHLCDPHYFIRWLSDNTKRMMLIVTPLFQGDGSYFLARQPVWRKTRPLPHFYELVPTRVLLINMLRAAGFPEVYELTARPDWPASMVKNWGAFLALKTGVAVNANVTRDFVLVEAPDYRDECSDVGISGIHSKPKSWQIKNRSERRKSRGHRFLSLFNGMRWLFGMYQGRS